MKNPSKKMNGQKVLKTFDHWVTSLKESHWMSSFKDWMKKASDVTIEESKVLAIRAKEAGKLTSLNAQKYKINRDYLDICAQIGKEIIGLNGSQKEVYSEPKVQELISKAEHLKKEIHSVEEEIELFKKECDQEIDEIHRKAS